MENWPLLTGTCFDRKLAPKKGFRNRMKSRTVLFESICHSSHFELFATLVNITPKGDIDIVMHTTYKRIELKSPGCTGFEDNLKCFKT